MMHAPECHNSLMGLGRVLPIRADWEWEELRLYITIILQHCVLQALLFSFENKQPCQGNILAAAHEPQKKPALTQH